MFKAIILLKRNDDWNIDDFHSWYLNDHKPLVRELPGLQKANFNLIKAEGESDFDTASELWFENEAALNAAYASEIGQRVAADSLSKVKNRVRLLAEQHEIFP
ncbi:MAG: EthD family reductase [Pseudomonadota bacterium]